MNPPRTVHALQFEFSAEKYRAVIIWPETPQGNARLLNSRKTWLTAQAGDMVWIGGKLERIKEVQLYRVHPPDQNGRVVSTAAAWLDGE